MKFILILLIISQTTATSMTTAEFDSKAACEAASKAFSDQIGTGNDELASFSRTRRFALCVPNGGK
jgi:hypothetical protein